MPSPSIDEFNRQVEWSKARSLRRRQQKGKTMTHDIGPLAAFVALAAVIGALAGSVLWGLLAGLGIVILLYVAAELVD